MFTIACMLAQRLGLGLVTLLAVSLIVTFVVELLPGDIAQEVLGQSATPETVAAFRRELGLDQPWWRRYLDWLAGIATGEMGVSLANGREIGPLLAERFANTLYLGGFAAAISIPIALSLGVAAALFRDSGFDRAVNVAALAAVSFPEFFVAYILVFVFAVELGWFPGISNISISGLGFWDTVYRTLLPAVTLSFVTVAHMMRMTRASIVSLMRSPYIEMAALKGATPRRIVLRHALPNAWGPIVNVIAINLAYLVAGVVIVEVIFVYPGLGQLLVDSVAKRDLPVVQAGSMVFAAVYILLNLLADILAILSNPRLLHPR